MASKYQVKQLHVMVEWGEVKQKFLEVVADGKPWKGINASHGTASGFVTAGKSDLFGPAKCTHKCKLGSRCAHSQDQSKRRWDDNMKQFTYDTIPACPWCKWSAAQHYAIEWEGGTHGQTVQYLRDGYRAPEFIHSAAYVPMAAKKRPTWADEPDGDLDLGRLYGGYDTPYMVPAEQEKKPGLRVMVEFAFAAGVDSSTIEQYGAWVAGLLGALESTGYDLTVDMWIDLDGLFVGVKNGATRHNVLVRVKRPNEVSDFTEWSALFGPTGYRHLGFCAKLVAGDKLGYRCSGGLGMTLGGQTWGLDYDKDESILKITVDQRGHGMFGGDAFPKDKLNAAAVEIGLIPEAVKQS